MLALRIVGNPSGNMVFFKKFIPFADAFCLNLCDFIFFIIK